MCGIAGFVPRPPKPVDSGLVDRLLSGLRHRGPDDQGCLVFSQHGVELGRSWSNPTSFARAVMVHRRLSILDLSEAGWQPMGTSDGRHYIVFNGEIYNYLELRRELQALGHRFQSNSDTEVLLAAYAQWGAKSLSRLVGMFAFVILDTFEHTLFLARDPFGIKPLYYTHGTEGFIFASEIKTLLEFPGVDRRVNAERLYLYLRHGITDHGGDSLFATIRQVPAAHYLELSLNSPDRTEPIRYWQVNVDERVDLPLEKAADQLRELFLNNVRLHLRSDVPVGAALSGGIDSSAIVMAMRYLQGDDLDLHVFSYVADDQALSEERWVDVIGHASRAVVHKIRLTPEETVADLERLVRAQDEPFGSTSIYAQYRVFQRAAEVGIKVMLDGQGGDELLGGYSFYLGARLASTLRQRRWGEAVRFLSNASNGAPASLLVRAADYLLPLSLQIPARRLIGKELVPSWLNETWFNEWGFSTDAHGYTQKREVLREQLLRTLSDTSLPHLLRYEDRNSMAFSIESRVPFLTPEIASFLLNLPEEYIVAEDGTSKAVFRRAMRGIVPDRVLDRRDKIGFQTPERAWLTALRPWVERVLRSEVAAQIPALNLKEMEREWQRVLRGQKAFDSRVWRWINLIEWSRTFDVSYR